jgi:hypothetical protein
MQELDAAAEAHERAEHHRGEWNRWREERNRRIVAANQAGVGPTEIARRLDQSVSNIGLILRAGK